MPDSTTINYLDLFTNPNSPLEAVPFKHYVTPEDTGKFGFYAIRTDIKKLLKNGNRKSPQKGSSDFEMFALNHGINRNVLMGLSGLAGGAGIGAAYLSSRPNTNSNTSYNNK